MATGRTFLVPDLGAGLEEATRDVGGPGQLAAGDLLRLTDVDDHDAFVDQLVDLGGVDLADAALDLLEELCAGGAHWTIT